MAVVFDFYNGAFHFLWLWSLGSAVVVSGFYGCGLPDLWRWYRDSNRHDFQICRGAFQFLQLVSSSSVMVLFVF
jgi:hypothetical protein